MILIIVICGKGFGKVFVVFFLISVWYVNGDIIEICLCGVLIFIFKLVVCILCCLVNFFRNLW